MQDYFGNMRNLRKLLGLERKVVAARPIQWDNEMREHGNGNLIPGTVWNYQTNEPFPHPTNIYIEFCTRKGQQVQDILNLAEHICDNEGEVNPHTYRMLREALEDFQEPVKRHYLAYGPKHTEPTMTHMGLFPHPVSEGVKSRMIDTIKAIARFFVADQQENLRFFELNDKPVAWAMIYTVENGEVTGYADWRADDPEYLGVEGKGYDELHDFNPYD